MRFNSEKDLVVTLSKSLTEIFNSKIELHREVSVGYGIADLVVSTQVQAFTSLQPPKQELTSADFNVLEIVRSQNGISLANIVFITKSSTSSIKQSLKKLIARELIIESESNFLISKTVEEFKTVNFAVEAKLKDWKRAMNQAYRYKWFADYSFVVLDEMNATPALKNLDRFIKLNIGFATINTYGVITKHFYPTRSKPIDPRMQMLFAEQTNNLAVA